MKEQICCICGKEFIGWGNNAWPVNNDENARCCDVCNFAYVIPARISLMKKSKEDKNGKSGD